MSHLLSRRPSRRILCLTPATRRAGGEGTRLGVAWQLQNGEVVFVRHPAPVK